MKPLLITSPQNEHFKALLKLHDSQGIKKQKRFLVSGKKVVAETLRDHPTQVLGAVIDSRDSDSRRLFDAKRIPLMILDKTLFDQINWFGTPAPLLICELPGLPEWEPSGPGTGLEVLLTMGQPANLGAAIRSASAFGADRIVLLKESASAFHPKTLRASSSANLDAPLYTGPSVAELAGVESLVILDLRGLSLYDFKWPERCRILIGEEGPGIPVQLSGVRVHIPIHSAVESLNATVATSIALYSYRQFHSKTV